MKTYEELFTLWEAEMEQYGGVYVAIEGVGYNIEDISPNGECVEMCLIRSTEPTHKYYLLSTLGRFEKLLETCNDKKPRLTRLEKVKEILAIIKKEVPSSLSCHSSGGSWEICMAEIDLPYQYGSGEIIQLEEIEKALTIFKNTFN